MISAPGIGSGLDVGSLVSQLVTIEGEPIANRLNVREAGIQSKISAFGTLKSALSAFGDSVTALKTLSTFEGRSADSGDADVFTATATSSAAVGSYEIEVVNLARSHQLTSAGFANADAVIGSGEISIQSGSTNFTVTIDPSENTVSGIRDAINAATEDTGVSATTITVDDGLGGSVTKLLFTADKTGIENELVVTVIDDDANNIDNLGLSQLVFDPNGLGVSNLTESQAAKDAQIAFGVETVTSTSNVISDAIEGVTLTLLAESAGSDVSLNVSVDNGAVVNTVQDFVSDYNDLRATITELTKFDPATKLAGVLIGDSGMLSINNQLQSILGSRQVIDGSFMSLSSIGVRTQADGTLKLDSDVLSEQLTDNSSAVAQLFTTSSGIAGQLDGVVSGLVGGSGSLDSRTQILSEQINNISDERLALDDRLASLEARLLKQFTAMDTIVQQLTATSNFLTQQLAGLQNLAPGSNN